MIASLTPSEAGGLFTVRREFDFLAARLAATHMTAAEIAAARNLVARQDEPTALRYLRTAQVPVTVGGAISVNRAFYRMIYYGSRNQVLI